MSTVGKHSNCCSPRVFSLDGANSARSRVQFVTGIRAIPTKVGGEDLGRTLGGDAGPPHRQYLSHSVDGGTQWPVYSASTPRHAQTPPLGGGFIVILEVLLPGLRGHQILGAEACWLMLDCWYVRPSDMAVAVG